jgi:hypothetical protein
VVLLDRGEVLLVDAVAPMLRRFDSRGGVSWTGGRAGSGPGAFHFKRL